MKSLIVKALLVFFLATATMIAQDAGAGGSSKISKYMLQDIGRINTEYADFAPTLYQGSLIFASSGHTGNNKKKKKNVVPADLFQSNFDANLGYYANPKPFDDKLNSKYEESSTAFSKDGNTMYFTRTNKGNSKLYKSVKTKGKWGKPVELAFNSKSYSVAHPALNSDNSRLYFASNMPGSFGLMDIWYVAINENGFDGAPINMGNAINTAGNDTYPYVSDKEDLYFASDTHPGQGGLDIFRTSLVGQDYSQLLIENVGSPINSAFDDYALILNEEAAGFFTSTRDSGKGSADIYKFIPNTSCTLIVEGLILERGSNNALGGARLSLVDANNTVLETVNADASGRYRFDVAQCNEHYSIRGSKPQYSTRAVIINTEDALGSRSYTIHLERDLSSIKVGDDLAKLLNFNPISFGVDRFNIEREAAIELEKVIAFMNANPNIKVDVRSHTDSRSRDSYNQLLSDKRNTSTIGYMIDKGVNKRRLSGKGYGESQPLNRCSNGVKCSEEEHQRNRRSEFIVVKI